MPAEQQQQQKLLPAMGLAGFSGSPFGARATLLIGLKNPRVGYIRVPTALAGWKLHLIHRAKQALFYIAILQGGILNFGLHHGSRWPNHKFRRDFSRQVGIPREFFFVAVTSLALVARQHAPNGCRLQASFKLNALWFDFNAFFAG